MRTKGGGSLTGTERNDVLLGNLGPDRLRGEAGDEGSLPQASAGNGLLLFVMPFAWLYRPVRNAARLGAHSDRVTNALRNRTPSPANRSRFGDLNQGNRAALPCSFCTTPIASQRWSSE